MYVRIVFDILKRKKKKKKIPYFVFRGYNNNYDNVAKQRVRVEGP